MKGTLKILWGMVVKMTLIAFEYVAWPYLAGVLMHLIIPNVPVLWGFVGMLVGMAAWAVSKGVDRLSTVATMFFAVWVGKKP